MGTEHKDRYCTVPYHVLYTPRREGRYSTYHMMHSRDHLTCMLRITARDGRRHDRRAPNDIGGGGMVLVGVPKGCNFGN
ncbi:hypothetical protein CYLTODRAFT_208855 [Cylindrobasidium torrendii FP15055 ss-10]|uniref:Uncharacterized protein n=1 Tax=Cylindrobasidium torrendii FP15055 ss-10 TaxID=1314674 RepID=A0A0D7BH72_9AGAR|nr:hypothetical protein CYLTODRAFT_208855 [Cylindrobasidium torrendii FP15055 ss-10]